MMNKYKIKFTTRYNKMSVREEIRNREVDFWGLRERGERDEKEGQR